MRTAALIAVFWLTGTVVGAVTDALIVARPMCGFFDPTPCSRWAYLAENAFMWLLFPVFVLAGPLKFIRHGRLLLAIFTGTVAASGLTYAIHRRWKSKG